MVMLLSGEKIESLKNRVWVDCGSGSGACEKLKGTTDVVIHLELEFIMVV